jgi:DNA-binding transcriptional LysR family regulator
MTYQLDLRDLRYFETIAEAGHLGRAAKQLCRSQPALTGCIRRLEQALGTQLFERVGRGIRHTPAGEVLVKRAQRLHVAADETAREMQEIAQGNTGHIRIGILPTVAQLFLAPVCRLFLAEAKGVTLKTILGQNDVLNASLKAGELDLVISFEAETDDQFVSHTISEDVCVVAAASSHEIFRKRVKMQDLLAYRWVLGGPSVESRQWLDRAFDLHRLPRPSVQIETNSVLLLPPIIVQTGLLSFISRRHLARGRLGSLLKEVRLKETTMHRWFKVMYRKDGYLPPAARRLVTLVSTKGNNLFFDQQKQ